MTKIKCGGCGGDYYTTTEQCDSNECKWTQYDNAYCCNKEMVKNFSSVNGTDYENKTCLKCGYFEAITKGQLDEEELNNFRELEGGLKE